MINKTQKETADELGIERNRLACWETGKSEPSINMLVEISKVLHTSIDDLLTKEL